jgi:hypothetical protein
MRNAFDSIFYPVGFVIALFGPLSVHAEPAGLTRDQQEFLLQQAAELEKISWQQMQQNHGKVIHVLRRAATDGGEALDLYLDAVKMLDYKEKGLKESDFRAWRDKNMHRFKEESFAHMLQLQAKYILLTMEATKLTSDEDLRPFLPKVMSYIDQVVGLKPLGRKSVLRQPIERSYMVRYLGVEFSRVNLKGWGFVPSDTRKLYDDFLFPALIRMKDGDALARAWERRMNQERALAEQQDSLQDFLDRRFPELQWQRAKSFHALGRLDSGLLTMLKILQTQTHHPDSLEWNREFQSLIQNAPLEN